jgi:stage II sporulation protein D
MAVGAATLRSTAFTLERKDDLLHFTGRGYGHGVGMCVVGAARRARRGETADAILMTYYPGLRIESLDALR